MVTSPALSDPVSDPSRAVLASRFIARFLSTPEPASSPAAHWTLLGRIGAAATLILAPAFQLASFMLGLENPTTTELARWAASEPSRANLSALFGLLAMPFLFGTALVYVLLSRQRSPRFAWTGGILLGFAFVGLTAVGGLETALISLSQDGRLDATSLGAAADGAATPPMIAIMIMFLPCALFGLLAMTVALWRSHAVPRAAVLLLPAFIVVDFFLHKGVAGHAIFLAAGIWFAFAVLSTPITGAQPILAPLVKAKISHRFSSAKSFNGPIPAAFAAIVSGLAWLMKYALIDANGGPLASPGTGTETFWIPVTYLLGLATLLVAGALTAWALSRVAPLWMRFIAAGFGAAAAFGLHRLMHAIGSAVYTTQDWKRDEVSIWTTALIVLVSGIVALAIDAFGPRSREAVPAQSVD